MRAPDTDVLPAIAALMDDQATSQCDEACRDYHRAFTYLRIYNPPRAVERDHEALLDVLGRLVTDGARRVLVSGSADTGILAYVIDAFQRAGVTGSVVVADRCPTPLAANRWYGEHRGWDVDTWCGDIRAFDGDGFDLVVAHNFLTNFFAPTDRPAVASAWRTALVPGGQALVVTGLDRPTRTAPAPYGRERTDRTVAAITAQRAASDHRDLISAERLEQVFRRYAGRERRGHPVHDVADVVDPIMAGGLGILSVTRREVALSPGNTEQRVKVRIDVLAERPAIGAASGETR